VPDADLFVALREGAPRLVTDENSKPSPKNGLKLKSGGRAGSRLVVTATSPQAARPGGMQCAWTATASISQDHEATRA